MKRSCLSNRVVPNMGILVRQVNRYLSLIEIPLSQEGRLKGCSEKTTRFFGLPV
ncbi:hypothetical protein ACWIGM_06300 [Bosea sp. NPDC055332]